MTDSTDSKAIKAMTPVFSFRKRRVVSVCLFWNVMFSEDRADSGTTADLCAGLKGQ